MQNLGKCSLALLFVLVLVLPVFSTISFGYNSANPILNNNSPNICPYSCWGTKYYSSYQFYDNPSNAGTINNEGNGYNSGTFQCNPTSYSFSVNAQQNTGYDYAYWGTGGGGSIQPSSTSNPATFTNLCPGSGSLTAYYGLYYTNSIHSATDQLISNNYGISTVDPYNLASSSSSSYIYFNPTESAGTSTGQLFQPSLRSVAYGCCSDLPAGYAAVCYGYCGNPGQLTSQSSVLQFSSSGLNAQTFVNDNVQSDVDYSFTSYSTGQWFDTAYDFCIVPSGSSSCNASGEYEIMILPFFTNFEGDGTCYAGYSGSTNNNLGGTWNGSGMDFWMCWYDGGGSQEVVQFITCPCNAPDGYSIYNTGTFGVSLSLAVQKVASEFGLNLNDYVVFGLNYGSEYGANCPPQLNWIDGFPCSSVGLPDTQVNYDFQLGSWTMTANDNQFTIVS
jgi:hypothetical protein